MRTIAIGLIIASTILWLTSLLGSHNARTPFGTPLGGDFPAFYSAGAILNHYGPARLYDVDLQWGLFHRLLPDEPNTSNLPYAYPPAIAILFRPLALLPYPAAYAVWTLLSIAFYTAALALLFKTCTAIPSSDRWLAIWLSLSFEPFLIECIHGGQLSILAVLLVSAAIALDRRGLTIASGAAIGLLAYKPTLLIILLPILILSGRWKMLAGAAISIGALTALSLLAAGTNGCADYAHLMLSYGQSATAQGMIFRTWKFVDLNSFLRLCGAAPSIPATLFFAVSFLTGLTVITWIWRQNRQCAWPAALAATLVLNLYVGIYDAVLIVPAAFLLAEWLAVHRGKSVTPNFKWLLAAVWFLPWISQGTAQFTGLQVYTLAVAALGTYAVALALLNESLEDCKNTAGL